MQVPPAWLHQLTVYPQCLAAPIACDEIVAMHGRSVRVAEVPPASLDPLRAGKQCERTAIARMLIVLRQWLRRGQNHQGTLPRWRQRERGTWIATIGGKRCDPVRMFGSVVVDHLQLEYALGA